MEERVKAEESRYFRPTYESQVWPVRGRVAPEAIPTLLGERKSVNNKSIVPLAFEEQQNHAFPYRNFPDLDGYAYSTITCTQLTLDCKGKHQSWSLAIDSFNTNAASAD